MMRQHVSARAAIVYLHDLTMTGIAFLVALWLRVGEQAFGEFSDATLYGVPMIVIIAVVVYRLAGLYRGIWRYASIPDLVQLTKAVTIVVLVFLPVMFLVTRLETVPRSVPPILWFVLLIFLGGPRFAYRLWKDGRVSLREDEGAIPVLVVGIGDAADLFIRSLGGHAGAPFRVVGIIDDKGRRVGHDVRGVPVLGGPGDLDAVVARLAQKGQAPRKLILAKEETSIDGAVVRRLLDDADRLGLTMARLPSLTDFKAATRSGKIDIRPIAIEDLLGRPQAVLDGEAISGLVTGRRVLVTGAGGTIGSELTRQIAGLSPASLTLVDACEFNLYSIDFEIRERFPGLPTHAALADVRDRDRVFRLFDEERPELVFHAAALKHVPMVEANPTEGALTNVGGSRNVADAARELGSRAMVLISTDKAIRPTSVMGATKRLAECYCQALDLAPPIDERVVGTRFMTVRFGNVLGSSGSVVPLFTRQLAAGGPLTVTHPEMRRYFMTVREAVELVLQASAHGVNRAEQRGKVLVLDMGEPVRIVDLARQMIKLAGLKPEIDVPIVFTGLRPGEKLFEEILSATETPTRTEADGVFVASPRLVDLDEITRTIDDAMRAAEAGDGDGVIAVLAAAVPGFREERPPEA